MKKRKVKTIFLLLLALSLILLTCISFVSAAWWDDFLNKITGRVIEGSEGKPDLIITDVVFPDYITPNQTISIKITVKNIGTANKSEGYATIAMNTAVTSPRCAHDSIWSSLVPGESFTKTIGFGCFELEKTNYGLPEGTYEITFVIDYDNAFDELDETNNKLKKTIVVGGKKEEPTPIPTPVQPTTITETIKCIFANSGSTQTCYSSDGKFKCSGTESCYLEVSGSQGTKLEWKSSCTDKAVYSIFDGTGESVVFECLGTTPTPTPTPVAQCKEGEMKYYNCPDGTQIIHCKCSNNAWECLVSPENSCPAPTPKPSMPAEPCSEGGRAYHTCEKAVEGGISVPWCECKNSKWVCISSPETTCPNVCAASIKISANLAEGDFYVVGDLGKVIVEVFDAQGNRIPNYPFYGQTYTYSDGKWQTAQKITTDKNGYYISTARMGEQQIGKMKLKVYTVASATCNSVEGSVDIEVRKIEYVEPICGNRICEEGEGEICAVAAIACKEGEKCEIPKASCKIVCPQDCGQETIFAGIGERFNLKINQKVKFKEFKNFELKLNNILTPACEERKVEEPSQPKPVQQEIIQQQPIQTNPTEFPKVKDRAVLYFYYWKDCPLCESEKLFLEQLKQKYPQMEYGGGEVPAQPSSSDLEIIEHFNIQEGVPNLFLDDKEWKSYDDSIAAEIENKVKDCIENGCSVVPNRMQIYASAPLTALVSPQVSSGVTGQVIVSPSKFLSTFMTAAPKAGISQSSQISTTAETCMSTPYAIISIKGCLGEQCAGIEATDIKLALGEKRVITGAEKLSITFLDYDRTSNTGAFIVEKVLVSPVVCPEKCKCDADGKTIECWAEIVKCPEDTTLCPDGICRESCEITNITTECKFGCFYGNKCLPIGVRVKGKYCSIDGDLLPQLAEGVCDNNFECRTNLCINGECIAESLWQKIFNWIKGLFS